MDNPKLEIRNSQFGMRKPNFEFRISIFAFR
jgi:hypothetical protein